jgi:hypothetical protein
MLMDTTLKDISARAPAEKINQIVYLGSRAIHPMYSAIVK